MIGRNSVSLDRFYDLVIPAFKGQYSTRENLECMFDYAFEGISFRNKTVIDIGGGSGLNSIYAAVMGAKHVVCLEPELSGSDKSSHHRFDRIVKQLSLTNIVRVSDTIQEFDPGDRTFDIVLMLKAAHHFDEEASAKLESSQEARDIYLSIFKKVAHLSAAGADLIVGDRSKYDFYRLVGVNNPFCKNTNWDINPRPQTWIALLRDVGFGKAKIQWRRYQRMGVIGRKLLANGVCNYFLKNSFVIRMKKLDGPPE